MFYSSKVTIVKYTFLAITLLFTVCCTSPENIDKVNTEAAGNPKTNDRIPQIGAYVVETFQDSADNLWFGTLEQGVAKYDGSSLRYLTVADGLL